MFKYNNPNKLRTALIHADEKKYYELKNNLKIIVLCTDQKNLQNKFIKV